MKKKLSEITRKEWIALCWVEATEMGDEERTFLAEQKRTPDEAMRARDEWDLTAEERET